MLLRRTLLLAVACVSSLMVVGVPCAGAALPWWHVDSGFRWSGSQSASRGQVVVTVSNLGDAAVSGEATVISVLDRLPAGLRALSIEGFAGERAGSLNRGPVGCPSAKEVGEGAPLTCAFSGTLPPYMTIEVRIEVEVLSGGVPAEAVNEAGVSGGNARAVTTTRHLDVGGSPRFGVEQYEFSPEEEGGAPSRQAGVHPFQLTTTLTLNQKLEEITASKEVMPEPVAMAKDLSFKWPPGLVGNPTAVPRCPLGQFLATVKQPDEGVSACPPQTAVGIARIEFAAIGDVGFNDRAFPLFNLEPSLGEPARFGFRVLGTPVMLDTSVRSGGDYGITVTTSNIPQTVGFLSSQVTVWGVPGDPRHDNERGYGCIRQTEGRLSALPCNPLEQAHPSAFLALPTACDGPSSTSVEADSWNEPGNRLAFEAEPLRGLDGCNQIPFEPQINVTPDAKNASSPSGVDVDVHIPQQESLNPNGLAVADPRNIAVALPAGVAVNPSGSDGLAACSEGLVGFERFEELASVPGVGSAIFTPRLPGSHAALEAGETTPLQPGLNFCLDESQIGTATIKTPLLANPLKGGVYLAEQNTNPFGSLIALYLVAEDPVSGVLVKLVGETKLCQATGETVDGMTCGAPGQLITTFENSPQAPFEDAELHFFGGERAPLATPEHCGSYTTSALFLPWSAAPGEPPRQASSEPFHITNGPKTPFYPGGSPCPGATLPFNPSLTGGSTNINAGSFTPLTTTIGREDGQQNMQSVTLHMPPGLSGLLTGVKLCPEAQANEGTCGPESLIGETTVSAGVGSDPVSVKGGRVYLTEKYGNAPFGLSIVNPVKAGPFDLEHDTSNPGQQPACDCVVVRARIEVDPVTAALTVTTDPSGPHAIPHQIDGIPVQIQKVNVLINRPGFSFNPTNCDPITITGSIASDEAASMPVSVPFQAANCAVLAFKPTFKVSTSGKTSRSRGASLHVKLTYPKATFGSQANIRSVKVDLPKQLPSRLTTLQKACTNAQFETNPAGCPAASIVGHAKAITPLIPVPLEGPAYFVSHGGAKFPELIVVLQGYGVTIDLHGETFISKTGITSSTFAAVPDQPVGSFELTLPQGKYSALAANGNLCKSTLKMPTLFTAQNGAVIKQSTTINVTGCPKHKKAHKAKAGHSKRKGKK
jgi:hypothetical protein